MRSNYSTILVYATMLLLASFLVFWVYGEYQREKEVLKKESYLDIAEKLIGFKGGDLYGILAELEKASLDTSIILGWNLTNGVQVGDAVNIQSRQFTHARDDFLAEKPARPDTARVMTQMKKTLKEEDGNTTISIVVSSDPIESFPEGDSMIKREVSMEFIEGLHGNLVEDQAAIRRDALRNIIPEMSFALFLFGLLALGIYFLQKSYANQREWLESKNNLISNLTHELKTPITTIGVALEAIQDFNIKSDQAKTAQYIQTSRDELSRLSAAIDQVMLLSKLDNHSERYDFREHNISVLCREVLDNFQLQIDEKQASAHLNIASNEEIVARVDEFHFKHMLYNLIDNSLKYGKQGVAIEIGVNRQDDKLILTVKDDGPGIDPAHQRNIFERFYRIPSGDRHDVKGYGLGLSYVREIVEAHKGKISVDSRSGKGTAFTVEIGSTS